MNTYTSIKSNRLGISSNWENTNFFKQNAPLLDFNLTKVLQGILFVANQERKGHWKTKEWLDYWANTDELKGTFKWTLKHGAWRKVQKKIIGLSEVPTIIGRTKIYQFSDKIIVSLGYFLNLDMLTDPQLFYIRKKFKFVLKKLFFLHKKKVEVLHNNFWMVDWCRRWFFETHTFVESSRDLLPVLLGLKRNLRFFRKKLFIANKYISRELHYLVRIYQTNVFFIRTFTALWTVFFAEKIDVILLSNIISQELCILRKRHQNFLNYIKIIFSFFFNKYCKTKIRGIYLIIKGRLTLSRRVQVRTQIKIIKYGVIKKTEFGIISDYNLSISYNRFGIVSVQVLVQQIWKKNLFSIWKKKEISSFININSWQQLNFYKIIQKHLYIKNLEITKLNFFNYIYYKHKLDVNFNNKNKKTKYFPQRLTKVLKNFKKKYFNVFKIEEKNNFQKFNNFLFFNKKEKKKFFFFLFSLKNKENFF